MQQLGEWEEGNLTAALDKNLLSRLNHEVHNRLKAILFFVRSKRKAYLGGVVLQVFVSVLN